MRHQDLVIDQLMESLQQIEKELLPYQLEVKPTAYNLRRILSALNVETL